MDLQTAIIGDILLYLISRKKSLGIIATVALFLSSTIACSIILYINGYHALLQANAGYDATYSYLRNNVDYTHMGTYE